MAKWTKKTLKLKKNHGWTSEPGCQVFVADRGAVRFDFPRGWVIEPGQNGSIKVQDKKSPDDNCCLEMTVFYLREGIDWSGLPVSRIIREVTKPGQPDDQSDDEPEIPRLETFPVEERSRDGMDFAWTGYRYIDPEEKREAISRTLIARKWNIQPIITYAFWVDELKKADHAWAVLIKTLILGDYIEDPTQRV